MTDAHMGAKGVTRRLVVTDLDNTLWDWFKAWHTSFEAMIAHLSATTGIAREVLEKEIRSVHQLRGTTEYSNLLNELPSLILQAGEESPLEKYDKAIHILNSKRRSATNLYPGVKDTLSALKGRGITIAAYTESISYWTEWRIKHTGLDGLIDVLYSAPDHDLPIGFTFDDLRRPKYRKDEEYGLKLTVHRYTPRNESKPNPKVLNAIISDLNCEPAETVYVGDSLMKDVAMAQAAGVLDIHAKYGEVQHTEDYELLRRVSHWPESAVRREQQLIGDPDIVATAVLSNGFDEIMRYFDRHEVCLSQ